MPSKKIVSSSEGSSSLVPLILLAVVTCIGFIVVFMMVQVRFEDSAKSLSSVSQKLDALDAKLKVPATQTQQPVVQVPNASGLASYDQWDLKFQYPASWYVLKMDDLYIPGQKSVRITSQPGTLYEIGGAGVPPRPTEFTKGFQMDINKFGKTDNVVGDAKLVATANPLVQRIDFVCDGMGCDDAKYLITAKSGKYVVTVNAVDFTNENEAVQSILNSIQEK